MKNKITTTKKLMFAALLALALAVFAAAQSVVFKQGDTVQTPDERTSVIEIVQKSGNSESEIRGKRFSIFYVERLASN